MIIRWEKLTCDYKKLRDNNKRTGAERMEFEFEEQIREIVAEDPVFNEVYNSDSRKKIGSDTQRREKEKKDKRSNAVEMLIDLNEQNRKDNREFQEKLLSMFGQLISAINQQDLLLLWSLTLL